MSDLMRGKISRFSPRSTYGHGHRRRPGAPRHHREAEGDTEAARRGIDGGLNTMKRGDATMASIEIAELTGKDHRNVLADIGKSLQEPQ